MRGCEILLLVITLFIASLIGCLLQDLFRPRTGFAAGNCPQFYLPPVLSVFSNFQKYSYQTWLLLFCGFSVSSGFWNTRLSPHKEQISHSERLREEISPAVWQSSFAEEFLWGLCSVHSAVGLQWSDRSRNIFLKCCEVMSALILLFWVVFIFFLHFWEQIHSCNVGVAEPLIQETRLQCLSRWHFWVILIVFL